MRYLPPWAGVCGKRRRKEGEGRPGREDVQMAYALLPNPGCGEGRGGQVMACMASELGAGQRREAGGQAGPSPQPAKLATQPPTCNLQRVAHKQVDVAWVSIAAVHGDKVPDFLVGPLAVHRVCGIASLLAAHVGAPVGAQRGVEPHLGAPRVPLCRQRGAGFAGWRSEAWVGGCTARSVLCCWHWQQLMH